MKALLSAFCMIALLAINASAQEDKSKRKSPPVVVVGTIAGSDIVIDYSSPRVKSRTTWGGKLVPYNKIWRTGANEATWISLSSDVKVEGQDLPAGKYSIFTIPKEDGSVTVIFNKVWSQWGDYQYDQTKDALRVEVQKGNMDASIEEMTFEIDSDKILLKWDNWYIPIGITAS